MLLQRNMTNFRKFTTTSDTLILAGKNATQNEELMKKYLGKSNVIMHTEKPGSPFCVITTKPKKGDRSETAVFCAKKSQDWRDNRKDVIVHSFIGKDVYKRKGMKLGTFGVKQRKNIKIKKQDILNLK